MRLRALCLDFDGVIADTENQHVAAWQRTLSRMGWELSDAKAAQSMRLDDRTFLAALFKVRGVSGGDVEGWVRLKQRLTRSLLDDAPRIYPGIAALIGRVAAKYPVGVVTTTWRENVEAVLGRAGLLDRVAFIVAKEDVKASKPHPEPYRAAVARLRLPAAEVVAVEDTDSGCASAHDAGLWTLYVGKVPLADAPSERFLAMTDREGRPAHLADTGRVLALLGWSELGG